VGYLYLYDSLSFADIALARRKEHSLMPLYAKRQKLLNTLEGFWPIVFQNAPDELAQFFTPLDLEILSTLKSFDVERYQIESETQGEPRSVRFTFEFSPNEYLEDKMLVKEVEYKSGPGISEGFVSTPVPIKWKNKKVDPTRGLLDAAVELYQAEQTLNNEGGVVDPVERESLWQNEKLHDLLIKEDESDEDLSFFCWFGFRGAILQPGDAESEKADEEDDSDDEPETMLDVEIFPPGEELTISLAEDLWPTAPVSFTEALMAPEDDEDEDDSDEEMADGDEDDAPELVPAHEVERPNKKRRIGRQR
jgi:Nucleosome assembly protein (NAP)